MASSTLLQKLNQVTDPLVSGTVGSTSSTMNRSQTEWFLAGSAIAAGDWVALDTAQTAVADRLLFVVPAANVALGNCKVVGVALAAQATTGGRVQVVVAGLATAAKVDAAVAAAGVPLVIVAASPSAEANVAANIASACGVSLAASAAGVAPVWVYKQF